MTEEPEEPLPQSYDVLGRETLYQGFFRMDRFTLRQTLFAGGWSAPFTREVLNVGPGAVQVLLFDPQKDQVILIEQFRAGPMAMGDNPWIMQMVAGLIEPGEAPELTARRESLEEAGCTVTDMSKIFSYYPSPGGLAEHTTLYVARTIAPEHGGLGGLADEHEDIRVHVLEAMQAISLLYSGTLRDAATIIALQWFATHHTELRSRWLVSEASTPII